MEQCGMTILVTGVAGFIGMHVADRLLGEGRAVIGIDNMNDYYPVSLKRDRIAALQQRHGKLFTFAELDFADMDALKTALAGQTVEAIIHLGAQAGVRYSLINPHAYVRSNLAGHVNMLELARERRERHPVYTLPHPSMAAMTCCLSASRTAPTIPSRSMPLPSAPTN